MAKLKVSDSNLAVVSHQEFITFQFDYNKLSWNFKKVVKCSESVPKTSGSIECCAFSPCGKYFGTCFDKNIIIYNTVDWTAQYICPGERKASSLQFFQKSKMVLVADKSGCAIFYSFNDNKLQRTELALGHNSMLTSALITCNEKYVITSDRDEKIRITNYPNIYNIEKYCLGHEMFVSCIGFLPIDKRILISSSGDGTIRFWDFILGQQLALYNCNDSNQNENSKRTIINFVACEDNQRSLIAIQEYKSNEIKIISIKGDLNTPIEVELFKILTLKFVPWDIAFHKNILACLLPDRCNPLVFWSSDSAEPKETFVKVSHYLAENWDSFIKTTNEISDEIPVLFKREIDNLQEYEQRKKARLLKTGKTS